MLAEHDRNTLPPSTPAPPSRVPRKFIACVRSEASENRITTELNNGSVKVIRNNNVEGAAAADVVVLACKPWMMKDILGEPGMQDVLAGKLLVTLLAGVTETDVLSVLYPEGVGAVSEQRRCRICRVLPNTAAFIRQSITVLSTPSPPLPSDEQQLVTFLFSCCGPVVTLASSQMNAACALAGSGPAFAALAMEGLADGGVAMGIPRAQATAIAAQVFRGTAALVQNSEHPAVLRDKVSTPGGCTIGGLLVLEEAGVKGSMARSVREATEVVELLGQGAKNVNGTRR